jgi:hypothetical protein
MKRTEDILEKILLPFNRDWSVSSVVTDESKGEIFVYLRYSLDYVISDTVQYPVYDYRPERQWRHLDLWHFKTYLVARVPRYKDSKGFYHSVEVPWATEYNRLTTLLEKKQ